MSEKTQSKNSRKTASRKADSSEERKIVLVGTYKGDQLADWRGWYNYPISDDDKINEVEAAKIKELWLFKGTKDERRYKAEFVGVKTRKELIDDYGYPAKGKAHGDKYLLFKTQFLYHHKNSVPEDAERVIVRASDFAKRSPKIAQQLKAYLESSDRSDPDLAKRLPEIITRLRPEQLRVCEAAVQMEFLQICVAPASNKAIKPDNQNEALTVSFSNEYGTLYLGDSLEWLRELPDASVDLIFALPVSFKCQSPTLQAMYCIE